MQEVLFEWDERKNRANIKKHGISFQEAKTCFEDDFAEKNFYITGNTASKRSKNEKRIRFFQNARETQSLR
jgi:uncharacterized DUF497 family protein